MSNINSSKQWDPWKMYDMNKADMKAVQERAKRRAALKAEWQQKVTNPYKPTSYIFDPAIQRFASMKVTQYDHFKATPKSGLIGFFVLIVPVTLLTYFANEHHEKQERKIKSGEITAKDRGYKFAY